MMTSSLWLTTSSEAELSSTEPQICELSVVGRSGSGGESSNGDIMIYELEEARESFRKFSSVCRLLERIN